MANSSPYEQQPWLKSYPPNVPAEIPPFKYQSVAHLLEDSCSKYADRLAFTCMGKSITYAELDALSAKVAMWLGAKGLSKGDRVAVMMPNII